MEKDKECCQANPSKASSCGCKEPSAIYVDDQGRVSLPQAVMEKANIQKGDELKVVIGELQDQIKCICLMNNEAMDLMTHSS